MASSTSTLQPPRSAEETALAERFAKLPAETNRRAAFAAFAKTGLPHRRNEGWRWSDGHYVAVMVPPMPPPVREVIAIRPSAQHAWVQGYWAWGGQGWVWASGRWVI